MTGNPLPYSERFNLTIEEAAKYFRIGENKLRRIVSEDRNAGYVLRDGNRTLIKRRKFEDYLDSIQEI